MPSTPRSQDIFEISPRPFSVTPQPNSGFQYSRGSLRNDYFSNGLSSNRNFAASATSSGTNSIGSSTSGSSSSNLGSGSSAGISSSGSSYSYRQSHRKSPFSNSAIGTSLTSNEPVSTEAPQERKCAIERYRKPTLINNNTKTRLILLIDTRSVCLSPVNEFNPPTFHEEGRQPKINSLVFSGEFCSSFLLTF
ncbi:AAEL012792-PA [Aedes aegypti]|uniref:AAEL012792-PA n=1 Tax=Aedes aegypti TaxID=7159 RepID=Q16L23_AEDAE|nr:AAEL012792-PA [Aedes aegypti]